MHQRQLCGNDGLLWSGMMESIMEEWRQDKRYIIQLYMSKKNFAIILCFKFARARAVRESSPQGTLIVHILNRVLIKKIALSVINPDLLCTAHSDHFSHVRGQLLSISKPITLSLSSSATRIKTQGSKCFSFYPHISLIHIPGRSSAFALMWTTSRGEQ